MGQCQKDPTCGIFLKRGLFKDIKNDIPMCQTRKYKNTNTQIQHTTKCQKDPTCGIFFKRGLFKDIKNDIPIQYKFEHLSFAQLYEVQLFQGFAPRMSLNCHLDLFPCNFRCDETLQLAYIPQMSVLMHVYAFLIPFRLQIGIFKGRVL